MPLEHASVGPPSSPRHPEPLISMNPILAISLKCLLIAGFAAVAVWLGSPLVNWVFRRVDTSAAKSAEGDQENLQTTSLQAAANRLGGGRWIGMLERLAIFAAILVGFGEGIAIVLALKSLARYPELRATTSGAAERFIIGTFTSALLAAACAGLCWWLVGLW